jgi:hypothetical protein
MKGIQTGKEVAKLSLFKDQKKEKKRLLATKTASAK